MLCFGANGHNEEHALPVHPGGACSSYTCASASQLNIPKVTIRHSLTAEWIGAVEIGEDSHPVSHQGEDKIDYTTGASVVIIFMIIDVAMCLIFANSSDHVSHSLLNIVTEASCSGSFVHNEGGASSSDGRWWNRKWACWWQWRQRGQTWWRSHQWQWSQGHRWELRWGVLLLGVTGDSVEYYAGLGWGGL